MAARFLGASSIAAMLMIPAAQQPLDNGDMRYNPGVTLPDEAPVIIEDAQPEPIVYDERSRLTRDTGIDLQSCRDFVVCGTDLGIPFTLPDNTTGYLFGDTFAVQGPFLDDLEPGEDRYRAQVFLQSNTTPVKGESIVFTGAAGLPQGEKGEAPEFLGQWHILVNDGVSLPDGSMIISYQHTIEVDDPEDKSWHTDYAGLAWSPDGNHFELIGPRWENSPENDDPYQMWSMQRDGDYIYITSVRSGRRAGPMMLFRVRWDQMLDTTAYTYWNGSDWGEKDLATPILQGKFGEPSLRKLHDGTWALSYADYSSLPKIVTRKIEDPTSGPEGTWSEPKVQVTWRQQPFLYGGFIHPDSTTDNVILMVSAWERQKDDTEHGKLIRYDVSHFIGSL
ncbi:DUF4185 domain-containing protein [Candidatus Saccharibacteria bacterium]|nr:DUF4185 domain-containing protein [Candidatus Saccharibacteria bacterium]